MRFRFSRSDRSLFLLTALATGIVTSLGCSSSSKEEEATAATPEEAEAKLAAKLQSDTGARWTVHVDRRSNAVRFVAPETAVELPGTSTEDKARGFFKKYAAELHATSSEELRASAGVSSSSSEEATAGLEIVRFDHVLAGTDLPVFDVASVAEVMGGRLVYAMPGFRADLKDVARTAKIEKSAAEQVAMDDVRANCEIPGDAKIELRESTLGAHANEGELAALAWRVDLRLLTGASASSATCVAPRVMVNATTGAVITRSETAAFLMDRAGGVRFHAMNEAADMKSIDVTQTFDLLGRKWVMRSENGSPKVRTQSFGFLNINTDVQTHTFGEWEKSSPFRGAAVDAHYYATKALQYFKDVHGRNGLDGNGSELIVVVHDPEKASNGANAHYQDYGLLFNDDQLHIGDGNGDLLPLSAGYDILVHELAHGVTAHTSKLVYEHESGALNEAFSDVMAASAENWLPETRDARNNVFIGERATKSGQGFRRMDDPSADGAAERDHYRQRNGCPQGQKPQRTNDYCGVHTNSGIANRAFTLMTLGGTHKTSKVTVARGIDWDRARKLWFESFTRLTPQATFFQAASVQVARAATQGLDVLSAVGCAWFAVGVLDATDMRVQNIGCGTAPTPGPTPEHHASSCNGVTDGLVCNSQMPFSAMVCKNGLFSGAILCSDLSKKCIKRSAEDFTAGLNSDRTLACE